MIARFICELKPEPVVSCVEPKGRCGKLDLFELGERPDGPWGFLGDSEVTFNNP